MGGPTGTVVFGDVVGSRRDSAAATAWLRDLVTELNDVYGDARLADFAFTQGDELQGLLAADADPLAAVLRAALSAQRRKIRWVIVRGPIDPGEGPAIQRTGEAFVVARRAIDAARLGRDRLVLHTGDPESDELANDMAPALIDMLDHLTPTQREVGRLAVIDGLRQSEVAERLGKRRATVSVSFARAKIVPIERLVRAMRKVIAAPEEGNRK
jgi:RNA polymerase sigma factor (sigma-70 family)